MDKKTQNIYADDFSAKNTWWWTMKNPMFINKSVDVMNQVSDTHKQTEFFKAIIEEIEDNQMNKINDELNIEDVDIDVDLPTTPMIKTPTKKPIRLMNIVIEVPVHIPVVNQATTSATIKKIKLRVRYSNVLQDISNEILYFVKLVYKISFALLSLLCFMFVHLLSL
jgi:hypothetical protein